MLSPLPMQRATLYLLYEDVPAAALLLAQLGIFDPSREMQSELDEDPNRRYRELFQSAHAHVQKSLSHLQLEPNPAPGPEESPPILREAELEELNERLARIWRECSAREEMQRQLEEQSRELQHLTKALEEYASMDVDLDLLHGRLRFLDVRIGTVSSADVSRLRAALGLIEYSLTVLGRSRDVAHVAVAGLNGSEDQVITVLEAASFRRWEIPPGFRDHPRNVRRDLRARAERIAETRRQLSQALEQDRARHGGTLAAAAQALGRSAPYAQLSENVRRRGSLAQIGGWVPKDQTDHLHHTLEQRLPGRFVLESRDPDPHEHPLVPSALRYPRLLRPFAALVRNYGVPRYGELDPTWLFAITFVAMFGMMFGDIGHGSVIALTGLVLRKRIGGFAPFVIAAGIASIVFGFVYGSVFGFEEVIHALWMSPISDPILMLKVALGWGIGFVLLATAISVRNRMVQRQFKEALLEGNGLAGLAFYAAMLMGAYRWAGQHQLDPIDQAMVAAPLFLILVHKWHQYRAPTGERMLVVFIEGFETFMSYVTNTLSFLRVAAFALNHVALAVAVFTLAQMMGNFGHWLTVVLGNLFILILEGAIVAIQVLRLEYYEGFARFFSGDGREFRPLTLAATPSAFGPTDA